MKTLVLGGAGMLGHKVVQRLARRTGSVWWTLRGEREDKSLDCVPLLRSENCIERVDVTQFDDLAPRIRSLHPDTIINCVGVIKQRLDASNERLCRIVNAELPARLANLLSSWGGRLIHISTDCVFDGLRGSYTEDDVPNASDVYGRTKAMGEVHAENAITLRTSFIGRELRHHTSLLDWFLSQEGKTIAGYRNVIWSGVTTQHLAEVIETLVLRGTALTGVYHVSSGRISKHELLLKLRDAFDVDVHIETDDSVRRDLSLNGARFENALGYHCPTWSELITGLVDDPTPYPRLGIRASRVTNS